MTSVSNNTYATLCNGKQLPLLGLGTFQSTSDNVKEVIKTAVSIGYRHIDTARAYRNETDIGGAIKELIDTGVIKRTDIFVTTKLRGTFHRPENVEHALKLSLKALQLEYVDLYLMHSPMALEYRGDDAFWPTREDGTLAYDDIHFVETWKAMEPLVTKGLTKSIGVSNFNGQQLSEILKIKRIPCVMNQIENHPFLDQKELIDLCKSNDVMVTSYSPLGAPDRPTRKLGVNNIQISVAKDAETFQVNSLIKEIAKARGCSASQLLIAYNLNQGMACIPKSSNPIRMEENYKALKVSLTDDDIRRLDTLACNFKAYPFKLWENHIHYPFTTSHKESPASS